MLFLNRLSNRILFFILILVQQSCATVTPTTRPIGSGFPEITHSDADANNNGEIDIEEFNARVGLLFHRKDVNNDGVLENTELDGINLNAFNLADENSDRKLAKHEYRALRHFDFSKMDENEDGVLMKHEVIKW
jgi:hypothetical protein